MTSESRKWESLKTEYLRKVEKALSLVKHPRGKEVLEDVRFHLDRRFAELAPEEQAWERFQAIITEMGPPTDYAELLGSGVLPTRRFASRRYVWWAGAAAVAALTIVLGARTFLNERPVTSEAFRRRLFDQLKIFEIDTAGRDEVIGAFGEPLKYVWGRQVLDGDDLPGRYVAVYPNGFRVFVVNGKVIELRHEGKGTGYVFGDKLKVGSKLDEALEVLGQPKDVVEGEENGFEDEVLYRDIEGRKGYCYYGRADQDVRLWFMDYKVGAIYVTRSDYCSWGAGKVLKREDLPLTSTVDEDGRIVDKIDYPFVNDPAALGAWEAVDFVASVEDFKPGNEDFGRELFLKELYFLADGKTNLTFTWTKGLVLGSKTASKYTIKEMASATYMFMEWKSGDYTIRHRQPKHYVLKKIPGKAYVESRTVDKIDYPFVDDPDVLGTWKSVDFVDTPAEFDPAELQWEADKLFLQELVFLPGGGSPDSEQTWTRGLVLDSGSKTASRYMLREINGTTYMFYEWKSGDYTIRRRDPCYYVLRKE